MRLVAGLVVLVVVVGVFAGLGVPVAGRIGANPSLIKNGDFEDGLAYWEEHVDVLWLRDSSGDGVAALPWVSEWTGSYYYCWLRQRLVYYVSTVYFGAWVNILAGGEPSEGEVDKSTYLEVSLLDMDYVPGDYARIWVRFYPITAGINAAFEVAYTDPYGIDHVLATGEVPLTTWVSVEIVNSASSLTVWVAGEKVAEYQRIPADFDAVRFSYVSPTYDRLLPYGYNFLVDDVAAYDIG